jgi:uncharacterized membrane protein YjgN (DUF898 family)
MGDITLTSTNTVVNKRDEASIICPNCRRTKQTSISQYRHLQRPLHVKCACGSKFTVSLTEVASTEAPNADTTPRTRRESDQVHRLSFHGTGGTLFSIHIVNMLLMLCTLGIYQFWGKTKVRRYLQSQTAFADDRFAYHGTGKELWTGWKKAALIFGVPLFLLEKLPSLIGLPPILQVVTALLTYFLILVFTPVAMVNTRRYFLSRTSWRGIRFSFRGRVADFIPLFLRGALLTALTFGLYYPIFALKRYAFMTAHTYCGNQPCRFDGDPRDLFRRFLLTLLLTLPTLGLYWFWFAAEKRRYMWNHTTIATARFHSTITGKELMLLQLTNLLLIIGTCGLAWSWVKVRNIRFTCHYLTLVGAVDFASIRQEAQDASATGEGLMSFLDFLDAGLDVG